MHTDARGGLPRYVQLAAMIRGRIIAGALPAGARVPSEPELADEHDVSKTTAARALEMLVSEGLIVRHAGRGSFVAPGVSAHHVEVSVPPGSRVTARWPAPGELSGAPPGTIALVVIIPGMPEALYPADRASVVCS